MALRNMHVDLGDTDGFQDLWLAGIRAPGAVVRSWIVAAGSCSGRQEESHHCSYDGGNSDFGR